MRILPYKASLNPFGSEALSPSMWRLVWLSRSSHAKERQSATSHSAKHPKSLTLQNESPHLHAGQFFGRAEAVDWVGSAGLELDEQQQEEAIEKWAFSVHGALTSLGVGKFKLFLLRCPFRSLCSLSCCLSAEACLLYSLGDPYFLGYQWVYLGHIPVPL